jgi:hypothetical protein
MYDVEIIHAGDEHIGRNRTLPECSRRAHRRSATQRVLVYGFAALISATIHAFLLGSAFVGFAPRHIKVPMTEGAWQVAGDATAESVTMLVIPDEKTITASEAPPEFLAATNEAVKRSVDVPMLMSSEAMRDPLPMLDGVDDGDAPAKAGDHNGFATLFGGYMGQIKARIERVWEYPADKSRANFSCRVRIKQDRRGNVEEVALQRCGSNPAWQVSLVQAIQRASPLSAPPDEKVFTPLLTLDFVADSGSL